MPFQPGTGLALVRPGDDLPPPDRLAEVVQAVRELRDALTSLPAPAVLVPEPDLSAVVNAVNGLRPGVGAAEIAEAIRQALHVPPRPGDTLVAESLAKITKLLEDDRARRAMAAQSSFGAQAGSFSFTNDPARQVGVVTRIAEAVSVAGTVDVADVYLAGEVLPDQAGAGGELAFAFAAPTDLIWVRSVGAASRADPFGGTPTASLGIPCPDDEPVPITVRASTVKVFAPAGATVSVWGFRG
jgi:hypothetical protein